VLASALASPQTSIIIITYNGRRYLADCLSTVFGEAGESDEIIVVDNNSTDGTRQFIRKHYPTVHLVENRENVGFAAACNQGARLARGSTIVFLNQDTRVFPGWLDCLIHELDTEENVGLATSQLLLMSRPDRIQLCGQDVHYTGLVFARGYGQPANTSDTASDVNAVSGASFAIRRDLWEELGGFDETLYMYYEETMLSWRAQLAGYHCRYAPASRALHDYSPFQPGYLQLYYSFRNRTLLWLQGWRWLTLLLLSPSLVVAEFIEILLALNYGWRGVRAKLRAWGWIVTHPWQIRRMRAEAQEARRMSDAVLLGSLARELQPKVVGTGAVAASIVHVFNLFFRLNHRLALGLLHGNLQSADPMQRGDRA